MKGEVYINGQDAYTRWGLSLTEGALAAILTPPPSKDYITNDSPLEDGTRYALTEASLPHTAQRELTLPVHFAAPDRETFLNRYAAFCTEVLEGRKIDLSLPATGKTYHLLYKQCTQYSHIFGQLAKFSLKVVEPDPTDRPTFTPTA